MQRAEVLRECVVGEQATAQWFADMSDELNRFECLETANDAAERTQDAGLATTRNTAGGRRLGEKTTITGSAVCRVEDGHLAIKLEHAAIDERAAGEKGGVVVQIPRREIVRAIDDHVIAGEERQGVRDGDAVVVRHDL